MAKERDKDVVEFENMILGCLQAVGIPTYQFNFRIKLYSKNYEGVYHPKTKNIFIYLLRTKTETYTILELIETAIHEACHSIQWNEPNFVRRSGVMHDSHFYELFNKYTNRFQVMYNSVQKKGYLDEESATKYISENKKDSKYFKESEYVDTKDYNIGPAPRYSYSPDKNVARRRVSKFTTTVLSHSKFGVLNNKPVKG